MKYIDVEKLKEKIQPLYEGAKKHAHFASQTGTSSDCAKYDEAKSIYEHILWLIDTLQQEQPAFVTDNSIGSPDYERGFSHGRDFQLKCDLKNTDQGKVKAFLVDKGYPMNTNGDIPTYDETFNMVKKAIEHAKCQEQPEVDLEKVYDAYCKVCGHYHHTTPAYICRHACDYFKDFEALLNARKEE